MYFSRTNVKRIARWDLQKRKKVVQMHFNPGSTFWICLTIVHLQHMESICKAWISSYFAAMRSERRVTAARTVKCISSAYAKLMLLPLPLTPATIFLRRLLEREPKKDVTKAYAMHMKYIWIDEDDNENLKRRWGFDSIWHMLSDHTWACSCLALSFECRDDEDRLIFNQHTLSICCSLEWWT